MCVCFMSYVLIHSILENESKTLSDLNSMKAENTTLRHWMIPVQKPSKDELFDYCGTRERKK